MSNAGNESEPPSREWLLEPVGPNDVNIHVELGEGAELSPEIRASLDVLVNELHTEEVSGFMAPCPDLAGCTSYFCRLGICQPQSKHACYWDERCMIQTLR